MFEVLELFHLHLEEAEFFVHGGVLGLVLEAKLKRLIGAQTLFADPNLQTDILPARIIKGQVGSDLCSPGKIFASVVLENARSSLKTWDL